LFWSNINHKIVIVNENDVDNDIDSSSGDRERKIQFAYEMHHNIGDEVNTGVKKFDCKYVYNTLRDIYYKILVKKV
jgi:hypothetical protein